MKKLLITPILAAMIVAGSAVKAQEQPNDYLGLPGDNLNLYAVMKLFQESQTLEGFERSLNDENSRINNLDLNGDNQIDYIKVIEYVDGNVHNIVLRDELGPNESQDVAVFTVQRFNDGSVQIQLTGDEALYGKNYIIEPFMDDTPNPGYTGYAGNPNAGYVRTTPVEIAAWPLIRFIFMPGYVAWRSSWYWGYYPPYWHPWNPFSWHYYYGYHYNLFPYYYRYYRHFDHERYAHWNDSYFNGRRVYSPVVVSRIHAGDYRATYSHPDQRREGQAMFSRVHPEGPPRMAPGSNLGRRPAPPAMNNRSYQGPNRNPARRSDDIIHRNPPTTVNNRANINPAQKPNPGTARPNYNPNAGPGTTTNRSNNTTNAGQNTVNNRRPAETIRTVPAARPQSGQKVGSGSTYGQTKTIVKPSNNRRVGNKPSPANKNKTNKEPEKKKE